METRLILQFAVFLSVMSLVVIGGHVYLYRRLVRDTVTDPRWRRAGAGALAVLGLLLVGGRFLQRFWPGTVADVVGGISFVWMGMALFLLLTVAALNGVRRIAGLGARLRLPLRAGAEVTLAGPKLAGAIEAAAGGASGHGDPFEGAQPAAPVDPERRLFLSRAVAGSAAVVASGMSGYGAWRAYTEPVIHEVPVKLPGLPKALDGLSIAQLSDIHVGNLIERRFMDEMVRRTNALEADMVAITGDLVDGDVPALGPAVAALGNLRSRFGTFFVTGNHEYYSGHVAWTAFLERMGVQVLRNRHVRIGDGGGFFNLAGVDDWRTDYDLDKALEGRDEDRATVLLAHQPANFKEAAQRGVGLQLSGHTHGGQIFPFTLFIGLGWEYAAGLYREGDAHIYVSRGTGFWGPPMRIGSPPEIVKVVLTA